MTDEAQIAGNIQMLSQTTTTLFFYLLGTLSILFAIGVVASNNILRAAVSLLLVLCISAALYIMLGAEFIAGVQILVYVGGIVVVIAFAIMLTHGGEPTCEAKLPRKLLAAITSISFFLVASWALTNSSFTQSSALQDSLPGAKAIGIALLNYGPNGFMIPFEVISLLLLSVLIGAVVVAKKGERPTPSNGDSQ